MDVENYKAKDGWNFHENLMPKVQLTIRIEWILIMLWMNSPFDRYLDQLHQWPANHILDKKYNTYMSIWVSKCC